MLAAVSVNEIEILGPCEVGSRNTVASATALFRRQRDSRLHRWSMEYRRSLEKTSLNRTQVSFPSFVRCSVMSASHSGSGLRREDRRTRSSWTGGPGFLPGRAGASFLPKALHHPLSEQSSMPCVAMATPASRPRQPRTIAELGSRDGRRTGRWPDRRPRVRCRHRRARQR